MKRTLGPDAKNFVAGVVGYLKKDKKGATVSPRIETLLHSVTKRAQREGTAQVVTAVALTAAERQALVQALGKVLGRPVGLSCTVNSSLIAGMRITVADWVVDTSWEHQLQMMATEVL